MGSNQNLTIIMKKEQKKMEKLHKEILMLEKKSQGILGSDDKGFIIPKKYVLSKEKRRLVVKLPYITRVDRVCKGDCHVQSQQWFRRKGKDKPYIPEGFVEIDGDIFQIKCVKEVDRK